MKFVVLKEENNRKLSVLENHCFRTIVRVSCMNQIKINDIKSDLGIPIKSLTLSTETVWSCDIQRQWQLC